MQKNTVKNLNKLAKNLETLNLKSATEDAPLVSWGSWMIPLSNYSINETIFKKISPRIAGNKIWSIQTSQYVFPINIPKRIKENNISNKSSIL